MGRRATQSGFFATIRRALSSPAVVMVLAFCGSVFFSAFWNLSMRKVANVVVRVNEVRLFGLFRSPQKTQQTVLSPLDSNYASQLASPTSSPVSSTPPIENAKRKIIGKHKKKSRDLGGSIKTSRAADVYPSAVVPSPPFFASARGSNVTLLVPTVSVEAQQGPCSLGRGGKLVNCDFHLEASEEIVASREARAEAVLPVTLPTASEFQRVGSSHCFRSRAGQHVSVPTFVIIGAAKAGTSSLYYALTTHPEVDAAKTKELNFFDSDGDIHGAPFVNRYLSQFERGNSKCARLADSADSQQDVLTGEASPGYMYYPPAAARLAWALPWAKLIMLVRDPVSRAESAWRFHNTRMCRDAQRRAPCTYSIVQSLFRKEWQRCETAVSRREPPSVLNQHGALVGEKAEEYARTLNDSAKEHFSEKAASFKRCAMSPDLSHNNLFGRGLYAAQLEHWLRWFPREQLMGEFPASLYGFSFSTNLVDPTAEFLFVSDVSALCWSRSLPKAASHFMQICTFFNIFY
eukprot:gene18798-22458_t